MNNRWKVAGYVMAAIVLMTAWYLLKQGNFLSFDNVREHRETLLQFVRSHYMQAVAFFVVLYIGTAIFLPGALVLTVTGGMLFGTWPTVAYVNLAATGGAVIAFLLSRFFAGRWLQKHFSRQLDTVNRELARHGHNYLLILRIIPLFPFFAVNFGAGLTGIPLRTFVWTTSVGMLPGSFVYAFAGNKFGTVQSAQELLSWPVIVALLLLALFAILPVVLHHLESWRNR